MQSMPTNKALSRVPNKTVRITGNATSGNVHQPKRKKPKKNG